MCCGPFDYDYPTFGGKHQRVDRAHGRVGSILSDPITSLQGPSADSNLTEPPQPEPKSDDDDDMFDDIMDDDSSLDDELEGIEPLRSGDSPEPNKNTDDSTASSRWRPRPLR